MSNKRTTGSEKDQSVEELMVSASDNKALMSMITGVSGAGLAAVLVGGVVLATSANNTDSQVASEVRVTHESTENNPDGQTSTTNEGETETRESTDSGSTTTNGNDNTVAQQDKIPGVGDGPTSYYPGVEPSDRNNPTDNNKRTEQTVGTYLIKEGDTLSSISGSLGISIDRLIRHNEIADPNLIFAGAALELPPR